jgi:Cu+-exporting ATPase
LGVAAAFAWSLYARLFGTAGIPGMTHPFELTVAPSDGVGNLYLEVAAGVTTFILAGRYSEARSKSRAGAALRALLELGPGTSRCCATGRGGDPARPARRRGPVRRATREKIATDGVAEDGTSAWTPRCSPASSCRWRSGPATSS